MEFVSCRRKAGSMNAPKMRRAPAGVALSLLIGACSLLDGRREIHRVGNDLIGAGAPVVIAGDVTSALPTTKPIVVVVIRVGESRSSVAAYWVLHRPGPFTFLQPPGTYRLFAFVDENEDLAYQPAEPAGWYGAPSVFRTSSESPAEGLAISLRVHPTPSTSVRALMALAGEPLGPLTRPRHAGDVLILDDPRFSAQAGKLGFWDPSLFLDRFGTGIYFLQPYDPAKVPVLFVHGASGYPQEWTYLSSVLDRTRFQPWVFHYASGMRLLAVSDALADILDEVRDRYRIEAVVVVAHSMGGLVSRMAVRQRDAVTQEGAVKLLVTISTPWRGSAGASRGVNRSPVVVPSWNDVAEGSAFLEALHASRLPPSLAYHLFFGYRGGGTVTFGESSDGSVTLQSMLDRQAQEEAVRIHAFNEDHTSILRSAEVSRELNELLDDMAMRLRRPAAPSTSAAR